MKRGVEPLPEEAHALGHDDAVDAVLHLEMLVADVDRAVGEIVLIDARRLQQHLVERQVLAAGQILDRLGREAVGRGADLRLDADARRLEPLGRDGDFLLRLGRRRRLIGLRSLSRGRRIRRTRGAGGVRLVRPRTGCKSDQSTASRSDRCAPEISTLSKCHGTLPMPENPRRHRARSRTNAATQERNDGRSGGGGSAGLEEEKFRNWWRNGRGAVMRPRWQRGRRRQAHGIWQNNRRRERHIGANGAGLIGRPGPVVL